LRIRLKPWVFVLLVAAAIAAILFGIDSYRRRFVRSEADLVGLLPREGATVFFVNVAALRHARMLSLLAGSKPAEDAEYREFVRETDFDYTGNIDAIAGAANGRDLFFVARGRFDWRRLRQYAIAHGGACGNNLCKASTGKSGRWASFLLVQPDVMGLALSGNAAAAEVLRPSRRKASSPVPAQPVWVELSQELLKNPVDLPLPLRIFAISLESAYPVVLSLSPAVEGSEAAFNLRLDAECPSATTADTIRNQLQIQTNMLKLELAREHRQPNPADLTGLLTSGSFQTAGQQVTGTWPIRKELLKSLQ